MVESVQGKSHRQSVNPERKYIRLQEIGFSHFLAWPFALLIAGCMGLYASHLAVISVLICFSGITFFSIGHIGRKELAERREQQASRDKMVGKEGE
jgi:ABC-type bacteriocin/lantibiotic exporter with double-glycine peptidase domain